jgi:NADPH:quinone reductase-like Zn-dependent oxidoreductase
VLEIVDLRDPHPGPGQVRIAVRAAGVNPSDWKKRKGLMDRELPQTIGHEAARVVDELGEGEQSSGCADVRADDVRRAEAPLVDQAGEELAGGVRRDELGT